MTTPDYSHGWNVKHKDNFVAFAEEYLGISSLYSKQKEILNTINQQKYIACKACHSSGKTFASAIAAIAFLITRPNSIVILMSPTHRQSKRIIYAQIKKLLETPLGKNFGGKINAESYHLGPKWYMQIVSPNSPTNLQGFHADGGVFVVVDEADGEEFSREVLDASSSLVTTDSCKHLSIGNPVNPSGWFYDRFKDGTPWDNGRMTISAFDTPLFTGEQVVLPHDSVITPQWVHDRALEHGKDSWFYESRILGEFPKSAPTQLISLLDVENAMVRPVSFSEYTSIGCDVARHGDDKTVIVAIVGNHVKVLYEESATDEIELAERIIQLDKDMNINRGIGIDASGGYGGGTIDYLRKQGVDVTEVSFGGSPLSAGKDRFKNKRSELWWMLRDFIRNDAQLQDIPEELKEDLIASMYSHDSADRVVVERKEDVKKRIGRSTDYADSVIVALEARRRYSATAAAKQLNTVKFSMRNTRGRYRAWR